MYTAYVKFNSTDEWDKKLGICSFQAEAIETHRLSFMFLFS